MASITNTGRPADWTLVSTGTANAINTVAQPAQPQGYGLANQLTGLTVSWTGGAPAAGTNIQVWDGPLSTGTLLFDAYVGQNANTQGSQQFTFPSPLKSTPNNALTLSVAAAGGTTITKISAQGVALSNVAL